MLSLHPRKGPLPSCTPHLLPCRIHHDGPANTSKRYWCPAPGETEGDKQGDGKPTVHFRGRKLIGRQVALPRGYEGVVVVDSKTLLPRPDVEDEEAAEEDVRVLEARAGFEAFVVWGHEAVVEGAENAFVRGVEEFIGLAETVGTFFFWAGGFFRALWTLTWVVVDA